jgi:type I restriction enzyme M protein
MLFRSASAMLQSFASSELEAQRDQGADPEDPDEYRAASIFWVPKEARWAHLKDNAPQPKIGTIVDEAMTAIERDNPSLIELLHRLPLRVGADLPSEFL